MGDNHTSNNKLCQHIEEWLVSEGRQDWLAGQRQIRCQGHVINLTVQAFLFCSSEKEVDDAIASVAETDGFEVDIEDVLVTDVKWTPLGKLYCFVV